MRKIFCIILTTAILVCSMSVLNLTTAFAESVRFKGDVDMDGWVDNTDAGLILKYDAGLSDISAADLSAADANEDGAVDNTDASMILKYDAGILLTLCVHSFVGGVCEKCRFDPLSVFAIHLIEANEIDSTQFHGVFVDLPDYQEVFEDAYVAFVYNLENDTVFLEVDFVDTDGIIWTSFDVSPDFESQYVYIEAEDNYGTYQAAKGIIYPDQLTEEGLVYNFEDYTGNMTDEDLEYAELIANVSVVLAVSTLEEYLQQVNIGVNIRDLGFTAF